LVNVQRRRGIKKVGRMISEEIKKRDYIVVEGAEDIVTRNKGNNSTEDDKLRRNI
jgi:hypothetical protein